MPPSPPTAMASLQRRWPGMSALWLEYDLDAIKHRGGPVRHFNMGAMETRASNFNSKLVCRCVNPATDGELKKGKRIESVIAHEYLP